jgi:signal transduction histidine kinase
MMKGNEVLWLLENAMPRYDENRNIVWDGIMMDVTKLKNVEKELIAAKEKAEESDRLKSSFLANMSHEIRTPMNGIVGFLGFIERDDLPIEKRKKYANVIRSNIQQLLQLIGDIIDISKMDTQQLSLHFVQFNPNAMLDELEIFFQNFIIHKDKKIDMILDHSNLIHSCLIESDSVRVRQVMSNLIENAIKFTEKGYIRFGYQPTEDNAGLYFFVEDTGIGIPESKRAHIFERFRQVHDDNKQVLYGGTGLGLTISKNLVEMMGGKIGVTSKEGAGSTFYFTLPLASSE